MLSIADRFNVAAKGLAEEVIVAAAERTASVLTVIRAVLQRNILLSFQHRMLRVIFAGKADIMNVRAGIAEQQEGDALA